MYRAPASANTSTLVQPGESDFLTTSACLELHTLRLLSSAAPASAAGPQSTAVGRFPSAVIQQQSLSAARSESHPHSPSAPLLGSLFHPHRLLLTSPHHFFPTRPSSAPWQPTAKPARTPHSTPPPYPLLPTPGAWPTFTIPTSATMSTTSGTR